MDTNVRTPQDIFMMPQRLLVPLFQRPYVWNQEIQWEPLWKDLIRVAERLLANPGIPQTPHFLGAVVLQQVASPAGDLQQRTIIDGQQRLTTLQILLDAVHAEITKIGNISASARIETLIENGKAFQRNFEDKFKVLPTNKDREAFFEVMGQPIPINYSNLSNHSHKLVKAHKYFAEQTSNWINEEPDHKDARCEALEKSLRDLLQVVVIDLTPTENAQEIFETLNARGAVLTAADLIKNFVFQRLLEQGSDVESAYEKYWANFETAFWEENVSYGRVQYQRSSLFINQWLISKTREEIVGRDVFSRFKTYADFDSDQSMPEILEEIHESAIIYRQFIESADYPDEKLDEIGLFSYRLKTMELDGLRPVVMAILDPTLAQIDKTEVVATLKILESWLVRRLLVRAKTASYNKVVPELVSLLTFNRENPSKALSDFLTQQTSDAAYWPDDSEIRSELSTLAFYRRIYRGRARMIIEALEDHQRGWDSTKGSLSGARIPRGKFAIEHIMPQSWRSNWPLHEGESAEEVDKNIHTLGNLTLVTKKLNSTVSNSAWNRKRDSLIQHDLLKLNQKLVDENLEKWNLETIRTRTRAMLETILNIWPVPEGHSTAGRGLKSSSDVQVSVADLLSAGFLEPGQVLYPKSKEFRGKNAIVLSDGRIEVNGESALTPSGAAQLLLRKGTNGWSFWQIDPELKTSLREMRSQYIEMLELDADYSDDAED